MAAVVALEVAPDAVDVRAAVARVVELEQEGRPLQAVVVGPTGTKAPCPAEADASHVRPLDAVERSPRSRRGEVREIRAHDLAHASLRGGREVAGENAQGVERRYPDGVLGDVVGQRLRREDDAPPKLAIDGEHDLSGRVLLAPHRPFASHDRSIGGAGAGRPSAQKERLGDERVADDGEVPREMVAFEPPTPRAVTWRTED